MNDFKSLSEKNNQAKTKKERFGVCAFVYGICIKLTWDIEKALSFETYRLFAEISYMRGQNKVSER